MIEFVKRNWEYMIFSFFFTSINCWLIEIIYSLIFRFKFVLPGILSGPWCPIYGITFLTILLVVRKKDNCILNFIKILLIASLIEYITSYITEEIFNNVIWDYSDIFLNINGRICLIMSLIFAIFGYITIYYFEPTIRKLYIYLKPHIKTINISLISLFVLDILINIFII